MGVDSGLSNSAGYKLSVICTIKFYQLPPGSRPAYILSVKAFIFLHPLMAQFQVLDCHALNFIAE